MAATAAIESLYNIKLRKEDEDLFQGSSQQLVDCIQLHPRVQDAQGCYTYSTNKAFSWIINNGGIVCEAHYPYMGRRGEPREITDVKYCSLCVFFFNYIFYFILKNNI